MTDEDNPFASSHDGERLREYSPSVDPSIDHEPHRLGQEFLPHEEIFGPNGSLSSDDEIVENTVWDEPSLSTLLAGVTPDGALTYERWLRKKIAATSVHTSQSITALTALASGILAIIGTFCIGWQGANGLVHIGIVGPVTEEVLKIALATWIVEKRPYLFKSAGQVVTAAACSGLVFAVIENLIYLHIYIPNPQPAMVAWRWTVCVALHIACSTCAAFGLVRVWRHCVQNFEKPQLSTAATYITAAVIIHGTYNSLAVIVSYSNYRF